MNTEAAKIKSVLPAYDRFIAKEGARTAARPDIVVTEDLDAAFWGVRDSQYVATFGDYDLDCLTGFGRTPLDAIVDLLDKAED